MHVLVDPYVYKRRSEARPLVSHYDTVSKLRALSKLCLVLLCYVMPMLNAAQIWQIWANVGTQNLIFDSMGCFMLLSCCYTFLPPAELISFLFWIDSNCCEERYLSCTSRNATAALFPWLLRCCLFFERRPESHSVPNMAGPRLRLRLTSDQKGILTPAHFKQLRDKMHCKCETDKQIPSCKACMY